MKKHHLAGKKQSAEHVAKVSKALTGRKLSLKHRQNISKTTNLKLILLACMGLLALALWLAPDVLAFDCSNPQTPVEQAQCGVQAVNPDVSNADSETTIGNTLSQMVKILSIFVGVIVLAIAGLILAIVFIAVPALQRNSRDAQRKADISALQSAIATFVGNNNGKIPDGTTVKDMDEATTAIDFSFYNAGTGINKTKVWSDKPLKNEMLVVKFDASTAPVAQSNLTDVLAHDYVVYVEGAICATASLKKTDPFTIGAAPLALGPSRSYAIVYAIESNPNWICIDNV